MDSSCPLPGQRSTSVLVLLPACLSLMTNTKWAAAMNVKSILCVVFMSSVSCIQKANVTCFVLEDM